MTKKIRCRNCIKYSGEHRCYHWSTTVNAPDRIRNCSGFIHRNTIVKWEDRP